MLKRIISAALVVCLALCGVSCQKQEKEKFVDGHLTYVLYEDGTYGVEATNSENMPEELVIPSTYNGGAVTRIEDSGFANCDTIVTVTVPTSIKSLGNGAFYMCDMLARITLEGDIPNGIGSGALAFVGQRFSIYYNGTLEQWENLYKQGNWNIDSEYNLYCTDGSLLDQKGREA